MDEKRQRGEEEEYGKIIDKQLAEIQANLIAVIAECGLDADACQHHQGLQQGHHGEQRAELGEVANPRWMRCDVFNFVHPRVALPPDKDTGVVGDHRYCEHIQRALDDVQNPIGDRVRTVAVPFPRGEDDARHGAEQRRRQQDDEGGCFDESPTLESDLPPELRPCRTSAAGVLHLRDFHGLLNGAFGHWGLPLLRAVGKREPPRRERKNAGAHCKPKQAVPEHHPFPAKRDAILLRHRPVLGHEGKSMNTKRVQQHGERFVVQILCQRSRHGVGDQQHQRAEERRDRASRERRHAEDDGGNEERIGNGEDQDAFAMRGPGNGTPSFGIHPRHVSRQDNAERDAKHGNHRDGDSAKKPAKQEVEFLQRRGENELMRAVLKVARRGAVDECRCH